MLRTFASDNYAGVHPKIMEAIVQANQSHAGSYGHDPYTERAIAHFKQHFGPDVEVFFVFNGTGANVLGLMAMTEPFGSIFCPDTAHINVDESTAPETFTRNKLVAVPTPDSKLNPELLAPYVKRIGDEHHPQGRVVSISQSTEYATVYGVDEIKALAHFAHERGMWLHMDGARIANAAVSLGLPFRAFTRDAGVDVLSFGGTKNGMMMGEAVVVFRPELAKKMRYLRKQAMQLYSKMRFVSAQFDAFFADDLWKHNATHANQMAQQLYNALKEMPQVHITQRVEANGVFAILPPHIIPALQAEVPFYVWNEATNEVRLMCSFDTQLTDIERFAAKLRELLAS